MSTVSEADSPAATEPAAEAAAGRPPLPVLWTAAGILAALTAVFIASAGSYFFADDWSNLGRARDLGIGKELLTQRYFGHLAPGHRVIDWLVMKSGFSYTASQLILLAAVGIGAAAVADITWRVSGRRWLPVVLAVGFAASPVWVRAVEWLASGAHIAPSIAGTLVSIAAALRWQERRNPLWLITALAAFAAALAFYEKPLLTPLYAGFFFYLAGTSGRTLSVRTLSVRTLREDALLWAGYAAIGIAYYLLINAGGAGVTTKPAPLSAWLEYAKNVWLVGTAPLLAGAWAGGADGLRPDLAVAAGQLAVAGLLALSVWLRPRAWRAWAFGLIAVAVNAALIGSGRLAEYGAGIPDDLRYDAETILVLPLMLAAAFSTALPERRERRLSPTLVRAGAGAAGAVFLALTLDGYKRLHDDWPAKNARTYLRTIKAEATRLGATHTAGRAGVMASTAPFAFGLILEPPYEQLREVLRIAAPNVYVGTDRPQLFIPTDDGRLETFETETIAEISPPKGPCKPGVDIELRLPPGKKNPGGVQLVRLTAAKDSTPSGVDVMVDRDGQSYGLLPDFATTVQPGTTASGVIKGPDPVLGILLRPIAGGTVCWDHAELLRVR